MNLDEYQQQASVTGDRVIMGMTTVEYQDAARSTAIYPKSVALCYPALGLAGEIGELCEKIALDAHEDEIKKEVGDVLWYIANVALDCGLLMHIVAEEDDFEKIEPYFDQNIPAALAARAGVVCEMAKKCVRDDAGAITQDRCEKIRIGLRDVLRTLPEVVSIYRFTLTDCAVANIEKLKSRQERGVLKGSGDNR